MEVSIKKWGGKSENSFCIKGQRRTVKGGRGSFGGGIWPKL